MGVKINASLDALPAVSLIVIPMRVTPLFSNDADSLK